MPTYYAAGVSVRLCTTLARDSLTQNPLGSVGGHVKAEVERTEKIISRGDALRESCLTAEDPSDSDLTFLGKEKEVPFYCVSVDVTGIQDKEILKDGQKPTRKKANPIKPKLRSADGAGRDSPLGLSSHLDWAADQAMPTRALTVSVQVDKGLSFHRTTDSGPKIDLKIDVYYNGQFTHSTYVDGHSVQSRGMQKIFFSGKRIDRVVEAAWLLFSRPKDAISVPEIQDKRQSEAEKRWTDIAAALRQEVDALGVNKNGLRPPSGAYLQSLADMKMPKLVGDLQRNSTPKFGVVDVVVTLGKGKKYSTAEGYLRQPQRLIDPNFSTEYTKQDEVSPSKVDSKALEDKHLQGAIPALSVSSPNHECGSFPTLAPSMPIAPSCTPTSAMASASNVPPPSKLSTPKASLSKASHSGSKHSLKIDRQKPSIGFLCSALKANPKAVEDIANYGLGPPTPAKPPLSLSDAPSKPNANFNSAISSDPTTVNNSSDPTGLSPSFRIMSIISDLSKSPVQPPLLSPSPEVRSTFSIVSLLNPSLNHTEVNGTKIQPEKPHAKSGCPTWKEANSSGVILRQPSVSPITPGQAPSTASLRIEQQDPFNVGYQSSNSTTAPRAFTPAKQATVSLNQLVKNTSSAMSSQFLPSKTDPATNKDPFFGVEPLQVDYPIRGRLHFNCPKGPLRQYSHGKHFDESSEADTVMNRTSHFRRESGQSPCMKSKYGLWLSTLQRLARRPLRETNHDQTGSRLIPSYMLDTTYGTMDAVQPLEPDPQPNAASSSAITKRSGLIIRLKVPKLPKEEQMSVVTRSELSKLSRRPNSRATSSQLFKRKLVGSPDTSDKKRKLTSRSQNQSGDITTTPDKQTSTGRTASETTPLKMKLKAKPKAAAIMPALATQPTNQTTRRAHMRPPPAIIPSSEIPSNAISVATPSMKPATEITTSDILANDERTSESKAGPYNVPAFAIPELSRDCIISYSPRSALNREHIAVSLLLPRSGLPSIAQHKGQSSESARLRDQASKLTCLSSGKGADKAGRRAAGSKGGDANSKGGARIESNSGGNGGAHRQIRSERTGEFREVEVLMGVRFVIGC